MVMRTEGKKQEVQERTNAPTFLSLLKSLTRYIAVLEA
jgi:hypothetical protein